MPTEKRQRKKEGRQARLEAERAAAARAHRRRRIISAVLVALVVFGALVLISASGGDDDDEAAATTTTTEAAGPEPVEPECPPAEKPEEPVRAFTAAPPDCLEEGVDYGAVITTSEGEITVDLLEDKAPSTVNNFVFLARWGYFDGDDFHRVVNDFVIQGGDPVGDPPGTGGPGYQIDDELPEADEYQAGSLAMANSGPNTNGSQFFIVTSDAGATSLVQAAGGNAAYSLFGQVTAGMDVVAAIEAGEVTGPNNDQPVEPVVIESVEITEQ